MQRALPKSYKKQTGRHSFVASFFHAQKEVNPVNDLAYRMALQKQIKRRFYGHDKLKSKHVPQYAISAERQYSQMFVNLAREMEKEVQRSLPKIIRIIEQERNQHFHADNFSDSSSQIQKIMQDSYYPVFDKILDIHHITNSLRKSGKLTEKAVNRQWFQAIKKTLGVNILEDYYSGEFYQQILEQWIRENLDLISTLPKDLTTKLESTIMDGFVSGANVRDIAKDVESICNTSKKHARFIARDQIGKLQSRISRHQQEDAGVEEYIWTTSQDSRVRDSHKRLNNKKFRWDDPPVVDPKTGRRCHPGEDYGCRCIALPVFNLDITLPWEKRSEEE